MFLLRYRLILLAAVIGLLTSLVFVRPALLLTPANANVPAIGINLSPVNYWTPDQPFLDRAKTLGSWKTDTNAPAAINDVNGLPIAPPPGTRWVYAMAELDSPGATFELTYKGKANITVVGGKNISSEPGRIVFKWEDPAHDGATPIMIYSGAISELHIVRADQAKLFEAGEQFRPEIIDLIKAFSHFRTMDWTLTNNSTATSMLTEWGGSYGDGHPVPLATIVALANRLGARPWICLPANVTDDGITAALDYLRVHLQANIRPIIEPSNEVWNGQFKQANTAQWYGAQVARIAKLARGYNVGVVAMWQFVNPKAIEDVLIAFHQAGGKDTEIEAVGGADYLYGTLNDQNSPDGPRFMATNDVAGALANVAATVPQIAGIHQQWGKIARSHGWKYWTYEGGNYHLNTAFFGAQAEQLRLFYQKVQEAPEASAILAANFDNFAAAGGNAATLYNLSSPSTVWGYFGLIRTPSLPMYRVQAAKAATDGVKRAN